MKNIFFCVFLIPLFLGAQPPSNQSAKQIVSQIKKNITCNWAEKTVDTFKAGNPDSEVTGIISCMFADMNVLKKAVELKCNLIITHEPVFYNHFDDTENLQNNLVFLEKQKFIHENKLVVFRFHDHIHRTQPDGITEGMTSKLNLKKYAVHNSLTYFKIPEKKLSDYVQELKQLL